MVDDAKLSDEDLAILRLESPTVAGHTCKVLTVGPSGGGERLSLARLSDAIESRLERAPRLMQRLSDPSPKTKRLHWVEDEAFDIANHVVGWDEKPADRDRIHEIVAELMTTRLDRTRPLWRVHHVEMEGERSVLACLFHHCMADGMTVVKLGGEVIWDPDPDAAPRPASHQHAPQQPADGPKVNLRGCVQRELMPGSHSTPLDRHPTSSRTVAVVRASLTDIKQIGTDHQHATVNDVVLCLVAGGLRDWFALHGGALEGVKVKVPVSLHDHDERTGAVANHDSFMIVDVAVDESDPAARLARISAQTRELKQDHDAQTLDHLFGELRHVSGLAERAVEAWSRNPRVFTVNVSNVPGPRQPIVVVGQPVEELFTLAEIGDRHALRISVISMADQITFGLCADGAAVDDPRVIITGMERDLALLLG
jgi:hypothetical protein